MKAYLNHQFDFQKMINVFDELPLWSAPFGLKLLEKIEYKKNMSALDIGFGTGFPLTEIAMRLGSSSTVYGIDPWKEAIERTSQKLNFYGITNAHLIEGVAENIPLKDQSVELITSNNGINNVSDIDVVLKECARVIKPGGQFIQTMNLDLSMFEFYHVLEGVLLDLDLLQEIEQMKNHIAQKRPSLDGMIKRISRQGFEIKDVEQHQFNYRFADGTALLNHYFIRLAFMDSWVKLLPNDKAVSIFTSVEQRLNEKARVLGSISLSIPFAVINAFRLS